MTIDFRYTKHQVARGSRPDTESHDTLYLIKKVQSLRLTYQIRLNVFRALRTGSKLVLRIPKDCALYPDLRDFQKEHSKVLRVERV
jgi:hypothetical protein